MQPVHDRRGPSTMAGASAMWAHYIAWHPQRRCSAWARRRHLLHEMRIFLGGSLKNMPPAQTLRHTSRPPHPIALHLPMQDLVPSNRRGLWAQFLSLITHTGPQAVAYDWFAEREVASLDTALRLAQLAPEALNPDRIDDATWRDLDVRTYLKRIAAQGSLFARQWLYYRLRTGLEDVGLHRPTAGCAA